MNQDDWHKLMNVAAPAGALGFAVAVFRGVIDQCGGWRKWFAGLAASVLVAALVGLGLHDAEVPVYMQYAIVGLCAYVSRDILMALTQLSGMLAASPFDFFRKIRAAIRGDKEGQ